MPLRLLPLLFLAAGCLPACTGVPSGAAEGSAALRDALLNLQASLDAAGGGRTALPTPSTAAPPQPAPGAATAPPVGAPGATMVAPIGASGAAPPVLRAAALAPVPVPPTRSPRLDVARLPPQAAAQLLGQTPELLRLWLGEPALRRPEGPGAEIWLYAAERCALDLVLYRDRAGGRLRVAFAAARAAGEDAETGTEAECLRRIAAGGLGARPST
jgi:hypothetical protein